MQLVKFFEDPSTANDFLNIRVFDKNARILLLQLSINVEEYSDEIINLGKETEVPFRLNDVEVNKVSSILCHQKYTTKLYSNLLELKFTVPYKILIT